MGDAETSEVWAAELQFQAIKGDIVPLCEQFKLLINVSPWKGSGLNRVAHGLLLFSLEF